MVFKNPFTFVEYGALSVSYAFNTDTSTNRSVCQLIEQKGLTHREIFKHQVTSFNSTIVVNPSYCLFFVFYFTFVLCLSTRLSV